MQLHQETFPYSFGSTTLEITRLNVAESRQAWAALQPCLPALLAAVETEQVDGVRMGLLATSSFHQTVTESLLKTLTELFMKHTVRLEKRQTDAGELEDRVLLSGAGQLDATFGGAFEELMGWLDFCVELNFRAQFEKQLAASEARKRVATEKAAKAQPKD